MRSFIALLFTLLCAIVSLVSGADKTCGPPSCYKGCTDARAQVDFVFLVDISGSMSTEIAGVRNGLSTFANNIASELNAQFALVTFGMTGNPTLNLQLTSSASTLTSHLNSLSLPGSWEAGLETILASLNLSNTKKLNINYRPYAKKVIILLTDEDSDPAINNANRYQSSSCTSCCKSDISSTTWNNQWQKEINDVVNGLANNGVATYFMVSKTFSGSSVCNTPFQYCDPNSAVQKSDFTDFNAAATLNNLATKGYGASVQGQLLSRGISSRCFDVNVANNANFINNFFETIRTDLQQCDPCYTYTCQGSECQTPVYDKCGCDGKISNPLASYDCAGVCNGNHALDACGVCTAGGKQSSQCVPDCNGDLYNNQSESPKHIIDKCGRCSPVANPLFCQQDCDKNWTILTQEDFDALGGCVVDCNGVAGGGATYDDCGRCIGKDETPEFPCVADCAGTPYVKENDDDAPHVSDPVATCGECVLRGETGTRDHCGQCKNAIGYSADSCTQDCKDQWKLATDPDRAVLDLCNDCWLPSEIENFNSAMDECGICDGGNDNLHVDTQNVTCCHPPNDCSTITGAGITSCDDCPPPRDPCINPNFPDDPSKNMPEDECGFCYGDPMYGKKDQCGMCCTNTTVNGYNDCNIFVDLCGICFGFNAHLEWLCPNCDQNPYSTACLDCAGVPFGNATLDCEGVCGGTATDCNQCGDGVVGGTEECDDGEANGSSDSNCNSDCTNKVAGSQAAVIGGVVGAILAVVLLAAVAFLAFKYAVSRGLLSKASNTVDMGASNSNPLYKSETQVKSNPLYQA